MKIAKTDREGIIKVVDQKLLLNVDHKSLNAYRQSKQRVRKQAALEQEIAELKEDIRDIKEILLSVLGPK